MPDLAREAEADEERKALFTAASAREAALRDRLRVLEAENTALKEEKLQAWRTAGTRLSAHTHTCSETSFVVVVVVVVVVGVQGASDCKHVPRLSISCGTRAC